MPEESLEAITHNKPRPQLPPWVPDYVEQHRTKNGWGLFVRNEDGELKRTWMSWLKRLVPRVISLAELKETPIVPRDEHRRLARKLEVHLLAQSSARDEGDGAFEYDAIRVTIEDFDEIPMEMMWGGIDELEDCGEAAARKKLKELWRAGLVELKGTIDLRSNRPANQTWRFIHEKSSWQVKGDGNERV